MGSSGSGSGSSTTTTVDKAYNARMAAIAEEQQAMAQELFQYYKAGPGHWESTATTTATPAASTAGLSSAAQSGSGYYTAADGGGTIYNPSQASGIVSAVASPKSTTSTGTTDKKWVTDPGAVSLLQQEQEQIRANLKLIPEQTKTGLAYYEAVNKGIDIDSRVNQARADVSGSYAGADKGLRRWASKYGINPSSGAFVAQMGALERDKAAGLAGATTQATTQAEEEQFQRLAGAMGLRSA
jgi:hypothetical protein